MKPACLFWVHAASASQNSDSQSLWVQAMRRANTLRTSHPRLLKNMCRRKAATVRSGQSALDSARKRHRVSNSKDMQDYLPSLCAMSCVKTRPMCTNETYTEVSTASADGAQNPKNGVGSTKIHSRLLSNRRMCTTGSWLRAFATCSPLRSHQNAEPPWFASGVPGLTQSRVQNGF